MIRRAHSERGVITKHNDDDDESWEKTFGCWPVVKKKKKKKNFITLIIFIF